MRRRSWSLAFVAMTGVLSTGCGGTVDRDLGGTVVLHGPRFWTGDADRPWADGLVVRNGRIVRVLDRSRLAQESAAVGSLVALPGELAVPGLVDAHLHLSSIGLLRRRVDLSGARNAEEALARVQRFASEHPDDPWILGRGWDQNDWPDRAWPDADRLEQIVSGRPCALTRIDGHALWVNRTALAEAGIGIETSTPPGGSIHRDAAGRPTGILVDRAADLLDSVIPEPTDDQLEEALALAGRELGSLGLTGVHDMGMSDAAWRALRRLAEGGRFPLRVDAYADRDSELARRLLETGPVTEGTLRLVGIKLYADGALGSRGARLLEPYTDAEETNGLWVTDPAELEREIAAIARAGLQPAVHAIGDAANRLVLDIFERLIGGDARRPQLRPRIEHAQVVAPEDLPRFGRGGIVCSMQPTHATSDMLWAEDRLGAARLGGAYAWKTLLDLDAALAFGSDAPIESADPRLGLYAAVTRQGPDGLPAGGWLPEERLPLEQALAGYTSGAAFAVSREQELGRLRPGMLCDLTVFQRDLIRSAPGEFQRNEIVATVVGGQVMYPASKR